MAMPLTPRNLSICFSCNACVEGGRCRFVSQGVKIKFSNSPYIKDKKSGRLRSLGRKMWIKRPEDIKFITNIRRIQRKTYDKISAGEITKPDRCQKCGKAGNVDAHHPDYNIPDFLVFLCRSCHLQERPEKALSVVELTERAKQRRLNIIEKKWGKQIKDIIVDYHNQPEITAVDLSELMGISRERVRQFLVEIHGKGKSGKLTKRCNPYKSCVSFVVESLKILDHFGYKPVKIAINRKLYKLNNGTVVAIKKMCKTIADKWLRCGAHKDSNFEFIIGYYENNYYIFPIKECGKSMYYLSRELMPKYKEAWHLLSN